MKKTVLALLAVLAVVCLFTSCGKKYQELDLELKNKAGKDAVEAYFYPDGSKEKYPNFVGVYPGTEGGVWKAGKGGVYMIGYVVRPVADSYTFELVFDDGSSIVVPGLKFEADGSGHIPNEISVKDAVDPDLTKFEYDDGDPEPLQNFKDAHAAGVPMDGYNHK